MNSDADGKLVSALVRGISILQCFNNKRQELSGKELMDLTGLPKPTLFRLTETLCAFTGYPAALLFSSGFAANHGLLSSLLKPGDRLLQDRFNHASLLDGGLASGARMVRFGHNDLADLARGFLDLAHGGDGAGDDLAGGVGVATR